MEQFTFLLLVVLSLGTLQELSATFGHGTGSSSSHTGGSGSSSSHRTPCYNVRCPRPPCSNPVKVHGKCCAVCPSAGSSSSSRSPCYNVRCPRPPCNNPVKVYGKCCPVCPSNPCHNVRCPRPPCSNPIKQYGKCCPVCPSTTCKDNKGIVHPSGSKWKPDPCHACICYKGKISCKAVVCPRLTCKSPIRKTGYCCAVCPAPCKDNRGITRHHGITWKPDLCHTCTCYNGKIGCKDVVCPRLACKNPIKKTGYCCPVCPAPCKDNRGITRHHGITWKPDPCHTCTCYNGRIDCKAVVCPRLPCKSPIKNPGHCCAVCPAKCKDRKGNPREHGESWQRDPCTTCTCVDGEVKCATKSCAKPHCDDYYVPEGKCCPVCPANCKDKKGNPRAQGESWQRDPCTTCTCVNGDVKCATKSCALPKCDDYYVPEGKCCPVCPAPCKDKFGIYHDSGDSWQPDPCTFCTCNNGNKDCKVVDCAPANCKHPIIPPGKCCETCDQAPCIDEKDNKRKNGEIWKENPCKTCTCKDGHVTCDVIKCPKPDCDYPVPVPGKCCATCVGAPCIDEKDNQRKNGDIWKENPCKTCTCKDGDVTCDVFKCPKPDCDHPVPVPGECCATCDGASCQDKNGKKRDHEEEWMVNACEGCTCRNGKITCYQDTCPKPRCDLPIPVPGKCCHTCDKAPCKDKHGKEHDHDTEWKISPCEGCKCTHGKVNCYVADCAKPECDHPIPVDGECCPTCTKAPCKDNNGDKHGHGEKWKVDDCESCECVNGKVDCYSKECPKPDCDNPVKIPGQCCHVCKDTCDDNGETRQDGEVWKASSCKSCICQKGKISCDTKKCNPLPCKDPVHHPGQCCPVCPEPDTCVHDGVTRQNGEEWRAKCKTCTCAKGEVSCHDIYCEKPMCKNAVTPKGKCCPVCPKPDTCDDNGVTRQNGEEWTANCKTCTCAEGDIECHDKYCEKPTCKDPVTPEGQCCPVCPKPETCKVGKKQGICKPRNKCKKPWKPCLAVKCKEQGNVCCFSKKTKLPKSICNPQPPADACVIKSKTKTYTGECREKSDCRKPMIACAGYDRCTGGKWCCLKKKNKPPAALCGGM